MGSAAPLKDNRLLSDALVYFCVLLIILILLLFCSKYQPYNFSFNSTTVCFIFRPVIFIKILPPSTVWWRGHSENGQ